jgi:hypothetical protein
MKPQIQAKGLHIFIIVLMLLGILFLSVGYSIAESEGMTNCAIEIPGFIKLSETYGFNHVLVTACFEGAMDERNSNTSFRDMCDPGRRFKWCVRVAVPSPSSALSPCAWLPSQIQP